MSPSPGRRVPWSCPEEVRRRRGYPQSYPGVGEDTPWSCLGTGYPRVQALWVMLQCIIGRGPCKETDRRKNTTFPQPLGVMNKQSFILLKQVKFHRIILKLFKDTCTCHFFDSYCDFTKFAISYCSRPNCSKVTLQRKLLILQTLH